MTRLRALGYAALVTVVVFYYLAVPTLRDLFGPEVVLPAYAAVAVLAGAVTYHAVGVLSRVGASDDSAGDETGAPASHGQREEAGEGAVGRDDDGVDEMLEALEADDEE